MTNQQFKAIHPILKRLEVNTILDLWIHQNSDKILEMHEQQDDWNEWVLTELIEQFHLYLSTEVRQTPGVIYSISRHVTVFAPSSNFQTTETADILVRLTASNGQESYLVIMLKCENRGDPGLFVAKVKDDFKRIEDGVMKWCTPARIYPLSIAVTDEVNDLCDELVLEYIEFRDQME